MRPPHVGQLLETGEFLALDGTLAVERENVGLGLTAGNDLGTEIFSKSKSALALASLSWT